MAARKKRRRSLIQRPRLANGPRDSVSTCLDPDVEQVLRAIARKEKRSVSWLRARAILGFFGLKETLRKDKQGRTMRLVKPA